MMKYRINHFEMREFNCPCCLSSHLSSLDGDNGGLSSRVAVALVFWLEVLRRALGRPLTINSGFRCASRNIGVGGSATSRHLIGCAADVARPDGVSYTDLVNMARRFSGGMWEIVTYPSETYFHLAVPRDEAGRLWNGEQDITL